MPRRFNRYRSGFRSPARRTNWIGFSDSQENLGLGPNDEAVITLMDPSDNTQEVSKYTSPTLIRVRGFLQADPVFTPSTLTPQFVMAGAALVVSEAAPTVTGNPDFWSSDNIIWVGAYGFNMNSDINAGTPGGNWVSYALQNQIREIDVKAMRKLEDNKKLFLVLYTSSDATVGMEFGYIIRALIKE